MSNKSFREIIDEMMVDNKKNPQRDDHSVYPQAHLRMLREDTPMVKRQNTLSQLDTRIPIVMRDRPTLTDQEVKNALSLYKKDIDDLEERELELYL